MAARTLISILKDAQTETAIRLDKLDRGVRQQLYQRWIAYFGYERLVGAEVKRFNPSWDGTAMAKELFTADPYMQLFQFLLDEQLINGKDPDI